VVLAPRWWPRCGARKPTQDFVLGRGGREHGALGGTRVASVAAGEAGAPSWVRTRGNALGSGAPSDQVNADEVWFAVFLRVQNQTDRVLTHSNSFKIVDTQGNTYRPLQLDAIRATKHAVVDSGLNLISAVSVTSSRPKTRAAS